LSGIKKRTRNVKTAWRRLDREVKNKLAFVRRQGVKIGCDTCSTPHCCSYLPATWHAEVFAIVHLLSSWPLEKRLKTLAALRSWLATYRAAPKETQVNDTEWLRLRVPCPFLEEGRCGIYAVRPAACRGYYVVDQGADACLDADSKDIMLHVGDEHSRFSAMVVTSPQTLIYGPLPLMFLQAIGAEDTASEMLAYFTQSQANVLGNSNGDP
jgi:Fe-S-cluster containining protein